MSTNGTWCDSSTKQPGLPDRARRAFLLGRGPSGHNTRAATPWTQFCQRLARACLGRVVTGTNSARLAPLGCDDVTQALALCGQVGVRLALVGAAENASDHPVLWLDPTVALTRLEPVADAPGQWRAEAGVRLADLQAAGLAQFDGAPADLTLAHWLAGPAGTLCATRSTLARGVVSLDVVLADGSHTTFGPFGEHATEPLRGAAMQRLVPRLFELSRSDDAERCLTHPHWPTRARLDALRGCEVNLAHVLLGHGGTLAWIHAAVLTTPPPNTAACRDVPDSPAPPELQHAAARLDAAVKHLFDPTGVLGVV